jgi:aldehyde dehydrogenase (NAD+)
METGRAFMNVVGGSSAPAIGRDDIPVIDPSDGQEFTTIARSRREDIDAGVLVARRAYETVYGTTHVFESNYTDFVLGRSIGARRPRSSAVDS